MPILPTLDMDEVTTTPWGVLFQDTVPVATRRECPRCLTPNALSVTEAREGYICADCYTDGEVTEASAEEV